MKDLDPELVTIFFEEATEFIDILFLEVAQLKETKSDARHSLLSSILRRVHNLKGASSAIDIEEIDTRCHEIEEAFSLYANNKKIIPTAVLELVLSNLTRIETLIQRYMNQQGLAQLANGTGVNMTADPRNTGMVDSSTIRVATSRFDHLMGFSGELLSSHARMDTHNQKLRNFVDDLHNLVSANEKMTGAFKTLLASGRDLVKESRYDALNFGHLINSMNAAMKKLRMVPLKTAEPQWRQVVRDAAKKENKNVRLTVHSGNLELDKHVLDKLQDPMVHLLRNAVSHGIEQQSERDKLKKTSQGKIIVNAGVVGKMVELRIQDDGRGLDIKQILDSANKKQFLKDGRTQFQEDELFELLAQPGFSTVQTVSKLSGRGVGLDVVKERVESLGGNVVIQNTKINQGTTFVLSVPLSILSSLGLFVRCCNTVFAISVDDISRAFRVCRSDIKSVDGKQVVVEKNRDPIHLVHLSTLLGEAPGDDPWYTIVVLSKGTVQLGLVVDSVEGQQEYVTNALPWNLKNVPGVTGAVIRPDGQLAVALDVPYLFRHWQNGSNQGLSNPNKMNSLNSTQILSPIKRVLVVDDSKAARILGKKILEDGGYSTIVAKDGIEAFEILQGNTFDLVVSDVEMPNMDGLSLTKKIRKTPQLKHLPVILVTSRDKPAERAAGADAGADEYVIKGTFDQRFLLDLVSKYL